MPGSPTLGQRTQAGGQVDRLDAAGGWRLSLPPGPAGQYRWAQLDDYIPLPRRRFLWTPPVRLSLEARVSAPGLPGTWGFGFWNDPFQASLGLGGTARRLPALPNAAWFFYASPPNFLAFRDDLPAQGLLAATFRLPLLPAPLFGCRPAASSVLEMALGCPKAAADGRPSHPPGVGFAGGGLHSMAPVCVGLGGKGGRFPGRWRSGFRDAGFAARPGRFGAVDRQPVPRPSRRRVRLGSERWRTKRKPGWS